MLVVIKANSNQWDGNVHYTGDQPTRMLLHETVKYKIVQN